MPSPRETLLVAVENALKRIKVADGYNTDAGLSVTREPAPMVPDDNAAFITPVWQSQARATDPAKVRSHRLTTFAVIAKLPVRRAEVQAVLDDIVSDIELAMADQQFRYPNGYEFPRYQSAEPLQAPATGAWAGVVLTYTSHIPIR